MIIIRDNTRNGINEEGVKLIRVIRQKDVFEHAESSDERIYLGELGYKVEQVWRKRKKLKINGEIDIEMRMNEMIQRNYLREKMKLKNRSKGI